MDRIFHQEYAGFSTSVDALDEPGAGNACHQYRVESVDPSGEGYASTIDFQHGPVLESGANGLHNEQLLAIVIHRLQGFQFGDFRCRENALALTKCQEALMWLESRTKDRRQRGVEGQNKQ